MLDDRILETVRTLENPDLTAFRAEGGRALGFFCSYVPEELLNVDGLSSFRMPAPGCHSTEMADSCMGLFNCSYTRHCLEQGMEGNYAFLDGFVFVPGCDHMRRLYDNWAHFVKPDFLALVDMPHVRDEDALKWNRDEIEALWNKLAEHFSLPKGQESVWEGIRKTNRTRHLLTELDRQRGRKRPGSSRRRWTLVQVAVRALLFGGVVRQIQTGLEFGERNGPTLAARLDHVPELGRNSQLELLLVIGLQPQDHHTGFSLPGNHHALVLRLAKTSWKLA